MEDPKLFDPAKNTFPPIPEQKQEDIVEQPEQIVAEAPQEEEQVQASPQTNETAQPNINTQPKQETEQQANFKAVRDAWRQAERERDEYARKLQQLEASKNQPQQQDEDEILLGPDELAEGKHLTKVSKRIKAESEQNKKMRQELEQQKQQLAALMAENAIRSKYPDFDSIVNEANIKMLRDNYPDIANSIKSNPDILSQASSAYTMIKSLGIVKTDNYGPDRDRALKNATKPRPVSSVGPQGGNSPLSQVNAFIDLTDDIKAQFRKEMEEARRNM